MKYCLGDQSDHSKLWLAFFFMPFGLFFDLFDGKVARWRKKSSLMGQELDSLADLVCQQHDENVQDRAQTDEYRYLSVLLLHQSHSQLDFAHSPIKYSSASMSFAD